MRPSRTHRSVLAPHAALLTQCSALTGPGEDGSLPGGAGPPGLSKAWTGGPAVLDGPGPPVRWDPFASNRRLRHGLTCLVGGGSTAARRAAARGLAGQAANDTPRTTSLHPADPHPDDGWWLAVLDGDRLLRTRHGTAALRELLSNGWRRGAVLLTLEHPDVLASSPTDLRPLLGQVIGLPGAGPGYVCCPGPARRPERDDTHLHGLT